MAKVCAACSKINDENAKFCRGCGGALAAGPAIAPSEQAELALKQCPSCQKANKAGAKFCLGCGFRFGVAPAPLPTAEPRVAELATAGPIASIEQTETADKQCPSCQKPNKVGAKFCLGCGHRFETRPSPVIDAPVVPLAPPANVVPPRDVFTSADDKFAPQKQPPLAAPSAPTPSSPEHSRFADINSKPASVESPFPPPRQEVIPEKVTPVHTPRPTQPLPPLPQPSPPPQLGSDARRKPSMGGAVPASPAEPNEGKSKTIMLAVGAIALAAVVAGGAYWYLNKSKEVPAAEITKTPPASAPIAAPTSPFDPAPTVNPPAQSTIVQEAEPQKADVPPLQVAPPNPVDQRPEPSATAPTSPAAGPPAKPVGQAVAPLVVPKPVPPKPKPFVEKAKRTEPPPPVQDSKKSAEDLRKQIEDELRGITRK